MAKVPRYTQMFVRFIDLHPHPEGGRWTGPQMQRATSGFVNAAYFSNLLSGRIKQPGLDKLKAIADAMGFPPQLWLEETDRLGLPDVSERALAGASMKELLDNLLESIIDTQTGEPVTDAEISRRTSGRVTVEDLDSIRSGTLENLTVEQVIALSDAFDVDPAYWLGRGRQKPLVDREVIEALKSEENRLLLHRSLRLSADQKNMLLVLMEQLGERPKGNPD